MEYSFIEAHKMLNKVLKKEYGLKHPEKISYIDKIILWTAKNTDDKCSFIESEKGISVKTKKGVLLYHFKSPDINMS
jgi:hypothetical protein